MNIENLTDEELANMEAPVFDAPSEPEGNEDTGQDDQSTPPVTDPVEAEDPQSEDEANDGGAEGSDKAGEKSEDEDQSDEDLSKQDAPAEAKPEDTNTPPSDQKAPVVDGQTEKKDPPVEGAKSEPETPASTEQPIDYKAEFEKLVGKPIKANGKEITLKNTDEVLRLVQQGAGYAQKMEQLKPARKSAAMLESAGLLGNEEALSHMIDLYNGKPEAIARLAKDLKIDLFAVDMDAADQYRPTSHLQSDEAVNFQDTLKEVRTLEGGREAMALIDAMDQQSKDMIWGNAQAIRQIYDYKQSGVYDTVATEVERRRTLGQIPTGLPFIVAFQQVGEELAKASPAQPATPAVEQPVNPPAPEPAKPVARTPVATGPAPRKAEQLDARAIAAASPRGGVGQAKQNLNIYDLSDADIEKMSSPPA